MQLNYYDESQLEEYPEAIQSLEADNPDVVYVYMTCNAQARGAEGFNRWQNNEIIREFCRNYDKVLFDFADLDSWSEGEQNTYEYSDGNESYTIPLEHENFNGNEAGHTTYSSCEQKARAFWCLAAALADEDQPTTGHTNDNDSSSGQDTLIPNLEYFVLIGTGILLAIIAAVVVIYRR
ncbi:hypothetical protein EU537_04455 [Candidatus Thorarchaeota archaeon]|nr:MAG: hypothetical protein EU537_04455 [Candidatus Thorarchaeota archaeon]